MRLVCATAFALGCSNAPAPAALVPAARAVGADAPDSDAGAALRAQDGAPARLGDADAGQEAGGEQADACPTDMVLVDGEYCAQLEMKCLKSRFAKVNKKVICAQFDEPTRCVGAKVKKRFCMDRYEFPNEKGTFPQVLDNFYEAQVQCADLGKRICTESEWTMACEGPSYKPYPYGYTRDPKKCNGDRPYGFPKNLRSRDPAQIERLWQGVPSGSQPECISDYGVDDMPGNADELAASEQFGDGKYDNVTTGGPWYRGVRNQCRPKIYDHNESFAYYYLSFRCCAEPDGAPTEPRAPKQVERGWSFDRVRKIARLSLSIRPKTPSPRGLWRFTEDTPSPATPSPR